MCCVGWEGASGGIGGSTISGGRSGWAKGLVWDDVMVHELDAPDTAVEFEGEVWLEGSAAVGMRVEGEQSEVIVVAAGQKRDRAGKVGHGSGKDGWQKKNIGDAGGVAFTVGPKWCGGREGVLAMMCWRRVRGVVDRRGRRFTGLVEIDG